MIYCFHILVCLCLILFQTTLMPHFSIFNHFYDLLIPFIVYLGIHRSAREGVVFVLLLGLIMDGLSGGLAGIYLSVYFWLWVSALQMIQFFRVDNFLFLIFLTAAGIILENLIMLGSEALFKSEILSASITLNDVMCQILWVAFTGPLILFFLSYSQKRIGLWRDDLFSD